MLHVTISTTSMRRRDYACGNDANKNGLETRFYQNRERDLAVKSFQGFMQTGLLKQASQGATLLRLIKPSVPSGARDQILFARVEHGVLHVTVRSGAVASLLRFSQTHMLESCAPLPFKLYSVKVHVAPSNVAEHYRTKPRAPVRRPTLSDKASESIQSAADVTSDAGVRKALRRLAERTNHRR